MSEQTNADDLTRLILRNVEQMASPPTAWERETLAEIVGLPRVNVTRPPREKLLAVGMRPYHCHANCAQQVANDPDGSSRHVVGWLIAGTDLILHSVVEMRGQWLCLTPQMVPATKEFQFIPDPHIEWKESAGGKDAWRNGALLPTALRKHPDHHLRMRDKLHELVASGMSVLQARDVVDATLGADLRRMEPI